MKNLATLLLFAALLLASPAWAEEARTCASILDESGEKIGVGLSSGSARVELTIHPRKGTPRQRSMEVKSMKEEGLLRTRVLLLAPSDVAGTAFLMREKKGEADEQQMFLPALGKVRRITGAARKGSFMGTDFSYADLEVRSAEESECTLRGEETLENQKVWHLSTRPKTLEKGDAYSRAELWVHQKTLVPVKIELFDRKDELLKVMEVKRLQKKGGRWLATETTMKNVQRKTWTRMVLGELDLEAVFPPETFTARSLER